MKKFLYVVFFCLCLASASASDTNLKLSISAKELDKIEILNGTRINGLRGIVISGNNCVGFLLKDTGDKYTCMVGDWKRCDNFHVIIFDQPNLQVIAHFDCNDLYIAIVDNHYFKD